MSAIRMILLGAIFTICLLVLLAITRIIFLKVEPPQLVLTEMRNIHFEPPPEPPLEPVKKEEIDPQVVVLSSPPSIADLSPSLEVSSIQLPIVTVRVPLNTTVDLFSLEPKINNIEPKKIVKVSRPKNVATQLPKYKREMGISDLDGNPTLIYEGRFRWPSRIRSNIVRAVVKVELNERGKVRLIAISSLSDEALRSVLPSIVNGSKFTVPKKNGKPVNVKFNWPLILKKP